MKPPLLASGATNAMTVTVWNAGSPDNDQDGVTDAAIYVRTLDISGFSGASIVSTNGTGVAAGKQRIYYQRLVGGTQSQLGAGFQPLVQPSMGVYFH